MGSEIITISKKELYNLIREAIREELNQIQEVSDTEQIEIEKLYGKTPKNKPLNFDDCVEL